LKIDLVPFFFPSSVLLTKHSSTAKVVPTIPILTLPDKSWSILYIHSALLDIHNHTSHVLCCLFKP